MQKFKRGNLVHIAADLGPSMRHFAADKDAIILGSYADQYGGSNTEDYTVMFTDGCSCAWYHESQLTLLDKGGPHLIAQATARRQADDDLHSDLNWIVKNWPQIRKGNMPSTVMNTLMHLVGIHHPWGSNGEGINYYANAKATFDILDPVLMKGDVEYLKSVAAELREGRE